MDDASGRYTNSFFWGNSYYVGSSTECVYINENYSKKMKKTVVKPAMEEVAEFNAEPQKRNAGLTENNFWSESMTVKPPYKLGFYMMTISINASVSPVVKSRRIASQLHAQLRRFET